MALPQNIPTSFVPKQPVEMHPRRTESGHDILLIIGSVILGIAVLAAIGVFAYAHILTNRVSDKAAELTAKQASVSESDVESFIRLRDRLSSAQSVLSQHVLLSQFFDVLESLTLTDIRFNSLDLAVASDRSADLKLSGVARDFNALAAQSASFAADKRIKQAIFSDISADKNGTVTFSVNATIDPRLIEISSTVPAAWALTGAVSNTATTSPGTENTSSSTKP